MCDLHTHFTANSGSTMGISKSKATELISSTIFDYEPNSRYVLMVGYTIFINGCHMQSLLWLSFQSNSCYDTTKHYKIHVMLGSFSAFGLHFVVTAAKLWNIQI